MKVVLRFLEQDVQQILEMIEARKTDTKSIIKESEMTQKWVEHIVLVILKSLDRVKLIETSLWAR